MIGVGQHLEAPPFHARNRERVSVNTDAGRDVVVAVVKSAHETALQSRLVGAVEIRL